MAIVTLASMSAVSATLMFAGRRCWSTIVNVALSRSVSALPPTLAAEDWNALSQSSFSAFVPIPLARLSISLARAFSFS